MAKKIHKMINNYVYLYHTDTFLVVPEYHGIVEIITFADNVSFNLTLAVLNGVIFPSKYIEASSRSEK